MKHAHQTVLDVVGTDLLQLLDALARHDRRQPAALADEDTVRAHDARAAELRGEIADVLAARIAASADAGGLR